MSHKLPHNLEIEMSVLCSCLIDDDVFKRIEHIIKASDFYEPRHQMIFTAMAELTAEEKPTDIYLVSQQVTKNGSEDNASYAVSLSGYTTTSAHVVYHAKQVKELSIRRRATILYHNEYVNSQKDQTDKKPAVLIQEAIVKLIELQNDIIIGGSLSTFEHINEGLQEALIDNDQQGYLTGFKKFDYMTCGLQPSTLTSIASAPGVGKTDLALNWALTIGKQIPALIFEMEIGKKHLKQRLAAMVSTVDSSDIRRRTRTHEMIRFINEGAFNGRHVYVDYSTGLTALDLRQKIAAFISIYGRGIVFLDHIQLMTAHTKHIGEEKNDSAKTAELKRISKEFDIPIVLLNHITKEGMKANRPQLQDGKYSNSGDVDLSIFLWREDHQDSEDSTNPISKLELLIRKNRSGRCGVVYIGYDVTTGIMHELENQTRTQSGRKF